MTISIKASGNLASLQKKLEQRMPKSVLVGIDDKSDVAEYAKYVEYGWVQRVTEKQSRYLAGVLGGSAPAPGSSLVNPPRPFLRGTFSAERKKWKDVMQNSLARDLFNFDLALIRVGMVAAEDIRETIVKGGTSKQKFPKRSSLTMAFYQALKGDRKGEGGNSDTDKPLVLSGSLLNAITYKLE